MKKFTIKKGKHSSVLFGFLPHFRFSFKNQFAYKIKFGTNCLYDFNDVDDWDINKLVGVSTSYHHHVQSARIGWRCIDNKTIELLAYCYNKRERIGGFDDYILGVVKPGEEFYCSITVEANKFVLIFNKGIEYKKIELNKDDNSWKFKYFLFPFFGGNNPAPHDMDIFVDEV